MAKGRYQKWLENENLVLLEGWKRNGLTDEQIAGNMGISINTLNKWKQRFVQIRNALKIGHESANYAVERKLFQKAMSGNVTAMIFWLKNNWRDKYNDSALSLEEREMTKARKENVIQDTRIKKLKADVMERLGAENNEQLDMLMDKLIKEADKEHDAEQHTDKQTD
ncbi:small terminase subunit [Limosilactobacillus mucosae]|uniref:small terminase subunit n=1 Tax=Limosilactobacillus mucosae TaxID=97478 RepID=UPI003B9D8624